MVDVAALPFDDVNEDEKIRYQARIKETGEYLGYKLPQYWVRGVIRSRLTTVLTIDQHIANGVKDRIEHYNCERTPQNLSRHPLKHTSSQKRQSPRTPEYSSSILA